VIAERQPARCFVSLSSHIAPATTVTLGTQYIIAVELDSRKILHKSKHLLILEFYQLAKCAWDLLSKFVFVLRINTNLSAGFE
jgi:hypothetical protein